MPQPSLLIADDEIHIVSILERRFVREGWSVRVTRSGSEALEAAQQETPDITILDYQMPGLNGLETAEAFAEDPSLRNVPILLLTARGHLVEEERLAATGIRDVLQKPFSAGHVVRCVTNALNGQERAA